MNSFNTSNDRRRKTGINNQNKEFKSPNSNFSNYYYGSSLKTKVNVHQENRSKEHDLKQKKSTNNIIKNDCLDNSDINNPIYGKRFQRSSTEPSKKVWSSFKQDKKYIEPSESDSSELINYPRKKKESPKMPSTQKNILNNTNYGTNLDLSLNSSLQQIGEEISFSSQEEDTSDQDNNDTSCFIFKGSSEMDDGSAQFIINKMEKNFKKLAKLLDEEEDFI